MQTSRSITLLPGSAFADHAFTPDPHDVAEVKRSLAVQACYRIPPLPT